MKNVPIVVSVVVSSNWAGIDPLDKDCGDAQLQFLKDKKKDPT